MLTNRYFSWRRMMPLTLVALIASGLWSALICFIYDRGGYWVSIPVYPVQVLGPAVAFYLGFEGNAAYGRLWEARKIWGGIVNTSRSWATEVLSFTRTSDSVDEQTLDQARRAIIYRHLAWLAALRTQLRRLANWEHQTPRHQATRRFLETADMSAERLRKRVSPYLDENEVEQIMSCSNQATQLLHNQSQALRDMHENGVIDNFRHMQMAGLIEELYTLQGKCERIKNFPLPRQYSTTTGWFVRLFTYAVPLTFVGSLAQKGPYMIWWTVPASMALTWVFTTWGLVVNYSENPFEGLANDIPMDGLSRTIEIDMREILGETDVPPPLAPKQGILL